jgi:hypothetical protein
MSGGGLAITDIPHDYMDVAAGAPVGGIPVGGIPSRCGVPGNCRVDPVKSDRLLVADYCNAPDSVR